MNKMPPIHLATFADREAAEHCPECGRRGVCVGGFGPVTLWACPVCDNRPDEDD